jgi:nucleolar protein 4
MLHRDGCAGDAVFLVYKTVRTTAALFAALAEPQWWAVHASREVALLFVQVKEALSAVAKLHNYVLHEDELPGKKAKKAATASGTLLWARQVSGEGAHLKKWRLILRNVPFNVGPFPSSCLYPTVWPWQGDCRMSSVQQLIGHA